MSLVPPTLEYGLAPRDSAAKIFKRLVVIALQAAVGLGIGAALAFMLRPMPVYRASAIVQIIFFHTSLSSTSDKRAATPVEISATHKQILDRLNSTPYHQAIVNGLNKTQPAITSLTLEEISRKISCAHLHGTSLLSISATDANPAQAATIANCAADAAIREFAGNAPMLQIRAFASVPTQPSNRPRSTLLIGALSGGILLPLAVWFNRHMRRATG